MSESDKMPDLRARDCAAWLSRVREMVASKDNRILALRSRFEERLRAPVVSDQRLCMHRSAMLALWQQYEKQEAVLKAETARFVAADKRLKAETARFVAADKRLKAELKIAKSELKNARRALTIAERECCSLKRSSAYRVGMVVTWPARKVWGGIKCLRENGVKYTTKHAIGKVMRIFGSKVKR